MSCRILVLDDEPLMLRLWSRLFRLLNCSITSHSSGLEALEELRKQRFDIVITDLRMPYFSGYDFLNALQTEPLPYCPRMFVCSGYIAPDSNFDQFGVTRLIHKPFDINEEVAYFRELVNRIKGEPDCGAQ